MTTILTWNESEYMLNNRDQHMYNNEKSTNSTWNDSEYMLNNRDQHMYKNDNYIQRC